MVASKPRAQISPSLEDYLEAVLVLAGDDEGVRTTDIAARLGVAKASVNQAMGLLVDHGLIMREKYGPVYLTEDGQNAARAVCKRHRAIKSFLISVLGVDETVAEEDACQIEHVVSKETMTGMIDFMEREADR
ncbi:MAG: metal-dependent transcriptional regulator [Clostridia bacterium]|nr:metal-dependent transcriptional regulator [Clostridia bacterium]